MAVSRHFQRSRSGRTASINNDSHLSVKAAGLGAAVGHCRRIPRSHRGDTQQTASSPHREPLSFSPSEKHECEMLSHYFHSPTHWHWHESMSSHLHLRRFTSSFSHCIHRRRIKRLTAGRRATTTKSRRKQIPHLVFANFHLFHIQLHRKISQSHRLGTGPLIATLFHRF